jgi:hypothetical protein
VASRIRIRVAGLGTTLVVLFVAAGLSTAGMASAADGDSGGIGITVTVAPSDPATGASHGGTRDSGGTSDTPGNSGGPGGTGGTADPTGPPTPGSARIPADAPRIGIVDVSGLTSKFLWLPDPTSSAVELSFVVRNVSKSTFNSTARFWVDTTFGSRLSEMRGIRIRTLKPGETRTVRATLVGLGQWTVLHAHATFAPPPSVDGTKVAAVSRDSYIFVPPLVAGGIGGGGAIAFVLVKFLWFRRVFGVVA